MEHIASFTALVILLSHRLHTWQEPSNLHYEAHQNLKPKCFSSGLVVVFSQSIEPRDWTQVLSREWRLSWSSAIPIAAPVDQQTMGGVNKCWCKCKRQFINFLIFLLYTRSFARSLTEKVYPGVFITYKKANLRGVTGLVILLKIGFKSSIFCLCNLEIWWMTSKNNRAPLLHYVKLCASFQSNQWIQTGVTVRWRSIRVKIGDFLSCVSLKFDGWLWKINRTPLLCYFKLCA